LTFAYVLRYELELSYISSLMIKHVIYDLSIRNGNNDIISIASNFEFSLFRIIIVNISHVFS